MQVGRLFRQLGILILFSRNTDCFQCDTVEPVKVACGFCYQMLMYFTALHDTAAISVRCRSECDVGFSDAVLQIIELPALGSCMQKCLVPAQCMKVKRIDLAGLVEEFGQENRNGSGLLGNKLTDGG